LKLKKRKRKEKKFVEQMTKTELVGDLITKVEIS
jgi:hypothetical protein